MRTIIVAEFISLDGVVEAPETWHLQYVDEEMMSIMWSVNDRVDTMLLGRNTYESFAGAFAGAPANDPIAERMNRPVKVVVSSTITEPTWANTVVLDGSGDVVAGIRELKARDGADIVTTGSTRLARTMFAAGLVDELHFFVHPVVVGGGLQRFFEDDAERTTLRLEHQTVLRSGVVHAVYSTTPAA